MSSTYTDKNNPFSPSHVSIGFSQIAFSMIVFPKNDHTDCVQEEPLGLQCWIWILAIRVVVDISRCLDTLTWEVSAMLDIASW